MTPADGSSSEQTEQQLYEEMSARAAAAAAQAIGISPEQAQALSASMLMTGANGGSDGGAVTALCDFGGATGALGTAADVVPSQHASDTSGAMEAEAAATTSIVPLPAVEDYSIGLSVREDGAPNEVLAEAAEAEGGGEAGGEQSYTCTVCRKVFKREMNLIFHMTTHRPRQPQTEPVEPTASAPVKCQDCGKMFATKYQAKKHYLRRHFSGDKPFACSKCHKKRFVVKEDLTMHMKSCGNVYVCKCGIRLCSLGALKRHCKYFEHVSYHLRHKPSHAPDPPQPSTVLHDCHDARHCQCTAVDHHP